MSTIQNSNISWSISDASEEPKAVNKTGGSRKETLAERAKRFVGDALEQDETRDASAGAVIPNSLSPQLDVLIDCRIGFRANHSSQLEHKTSRASVECSTVSHHPFILL